jgi:hypothetical protein
MGNKPAYSNATFFDSVAAEMMKVLRGDETQRAVSQALGYSFNQFSKWENLETKVLLIDLFELLEYKNSNLDGKLKKYFTLENYSAKQTSFMIQELIAPMAVSEFSKQVDESSQKIKKWQQEDATVPLGSFLRILHIVRKNADQFIEEFVPLIQIPKAYVFFKGDSGS